MLQTAKNIPNIIMYRMPTVRIQLCQHLLMNSHFVGLMVRYPPRAHSPIRICSPLSGPLIKIFGNIPSLAGCFKLQDKAGFICGQQQFDTKGEMILQFCTPVKGEIYQLTGVRSFYGRASHHCPGARWVAYIKIDSGLLTCIKH